MKKEFSRETHSTDNGVFSLGDECNLPSSPYLFTASHSPSLTHLSPAAVVGFHYCFMVSAEGLGLDYKQSQQHHHLPPGGTSTSSRAYFIMTLLTPPLALTLSMGSSNFSIPVNSQISLAQHWTRAVDFTLKFTSSFSSRFMRPTKVIRRRWGASAVRCELQTKLQKRAAAGCDTRKGVELKWILQCCKTLISLIQLHSMLCRSGDRPSCFWCLHWPNVWMDDVSPW